MYYSDGNVKQARIGGPIKDVLVHLADSIMTVETGKTQNETNPTYSQIKMVVMENSISPISGTVGISFNTPQFLNVTKTYSLGIELVDLSSGVDWMAIIIAFAIAIPILCILGCIIFFVYKKYPDLRMASTPTDKQPLINH